MPKTESFTTWRFNFQQLNHADQTDSMLLYRELTGKTTNLEDTHFLSIMELAALIAHQLITFEEQPDHVFEGKIDPVVQASPHLLASFSVKKKTILLEQSHTRFFPAPVPEASRYQLQFPQHLFLTDILKKYDFYH